ncbi:DUF7544 domain-containing protein [Halopiger xanaduensis]|uniref:Glycerophosphoryl diester phosphodiesterase membrane domain-containing protein n=1 Tax=Halopiger xanaduensis (strain DSM 18323 / JCM 14033 / SH-6) TaxID=797210 RepID=F8DCV5_HALXS|nr:hypothetical protein [Halopiger xanaduensis]AEH37284.1 hypothetical protein Halxa_2667 [Halopiger xanaduensis SH-6]
MDAVDNLSDAIDATRTLLLPVRPVLWLKLAVVVFFVGGFGVNNPGLTASNNPEMAPQNPSTEPITGELPDDILVIAAIVIGAILLLGLLFALIGAIMEFVFIESLRSRAVHVRRYARTNLGRGLRLFGFRVAVGIVVLAILGIPTALLLAGVSTLESALVSLAPVFLLAVPLLLVTALVMRLTSEFVVPIMLLEERGVLGAWGRFWPTLRSNLAEYAVYLVLVWILGLVVNIGVGVVLVFGAIVVAIPFLVIGFVLVSIGEIGVWIAGGVAILGALTLLLFFALVQMPVRTYFQYYALLLLGDTNADLDLVSDLRREIRTADSGGRNGLESPYSSDDRDQRGRNGAVDEDRDDRWDNGRSDDQDADRWDSDESDDWGNSRSDDGDGDGEDDRDRGW